MDKEKRRHLRFWRLVLHPVRLLMLLKFGFRPGPAPELPEGGCLILSNHTTTWDPLLIGCALQKQMYFVASEHIFRLGLATWFLKRYFAPIARLKGSTDAAAAANMLRELRKGNRVMLFPEGNTTWTGRSMAMHPSVSRMARMCGVPVVTYRLVGGYLTHPRWCGGTRKGKMRGDVVNIYTPEQLKAMSKEEVEQCLSRDIFEDAYATQEKEPVRYKGRHRAERLETVLYKCPCCGKIAGLHSKGARFWCDCGLNLEFDEYGAFQSKTGQVPFKNTLEWDDWQEKEMEKLAESLGEEPAFWDEDQSLWQQEGHTQHQVAAGRLCLFKERLTLGEKSFPLAEISSISMFGREHVVFSAGPNTYEIKSPYSRSGRKYMTLIQYLKAKR